MVFRTLELGCICYLLLFTTPVLAHLTYGQTTEPSHHSETTPLVITSPPSTSPAALAQLSPDSRNSPFLRFIAVFSSGIIITVAFLAHKFRRYLGLGVFTNPFAAFFVILGAAICGLPVSSEDTLSSIPHLHSLGPWIADLSGIIVTLILPVIRLKRPAPQIGLFADAASANFLLAVIDDGIRDSILPNLQLRFLDAARYDWKVIKLAARRATEQESAIERLDRDKAKATLEKIEDLHTSSSGHSEASNKYSALLLLLDCCPYRQILKNLETVARESKK